jgi:predicted kinase
MLVLVTGLPATGKSTIAKNLARKLRGTLLRTDRIRRRLLEKPSYTQEEKELIYRVMFLISEYLLRSGVTVVLDGTFYLRSLRRQVYSLAGKAKSRLVIIECVCPEYVVRRRLERRAMRRSLSDADYEVYKKLKAEYEPIRRRHIVVDTSKRLNQNLEEIMAGIGARTDRG